MPTLITPTGIKVQGKVKIVFAPTASLTAPSIAVANGATGLDISNYLYADGWDFTKETATGAAPRRVGTTKQWQQAGTTSESLGVMRYVVDPQADAATDGKKAYEKFVEGTVGYLYERLGGDVEDDLAVGDWVRIIPVQFLAQNIKGDPSDEFAEFAVEQGVIVTAPGSTDLIQMVA